MLFLSLYFLQCALTCTRDGLDAAQIVLFDQKHSNCFFFSLTLSQKSSSGSSKDDDSVSVQVKVEK